MPEEVIAVAVSEFGSAAGLSLETIATIGYTIEVAAAVAAVYSMREAQRRAQNAQRDAYNASLKDRYLMFRSAVEPRRVVLGRQRVSGPLAYIGSYGADREHLVFVVVLAAHEIDAVEAIYFDDEQVTLDGGGNVVAVNRRDLFSLSSTGATFTLSSEPAAATVAATVTYGSTEVSLGVSVAGSAVTVTGGTAGMTGTVTITYQPAQSPWIVRAGENQLATITLDGGGNGTLTLPTLPVGGSVHVVYANGSGDTVQMESIDPWVSVVGSVVTVTASPAGAGGPVTVTWQSTSNITRARVRSYLGAPGQTADAGMMAALPGVWTSAHAMTGLAHLVVECDYDPDAFPGGLVNASAVVRGAKLYDPRSGLTVWGENPALQMRYVATSPLLGRLAAAQVPDLSISVAANVCDTSAAYVVNGQTFVRPLYTAGLVVKSGTRAKDALDDLARAMAGRWVFIDNELRLRAGAYVTPLQTLDDSWLHNGQAVQVQAGANRSDVFNVVTGRFVDERHDYVEVDYPRVAADAYIAADGAELPLDMPLNAVTFTGQAQQVVAAEMRDARQGLRCTVLCNMRAYPVESFDALYVNLPRFGWAGKPFDVLDAKMTIDGGIQLDLKETDPGTWDLGTSFAAQDPAPNTLFPSPFKIPAITGLACASGTGQLLRQADGTIQTRVAVTYDAITDALVLEGGGVEVRYGLAGTAEDTWQSERAERGQSLVYLTANIRDTLLYLVKARAFNALVKGAWCVPVLHQVVGKSALPANVAGFSVTAIPTGLRFSRTPSAEVDWAEMEVHEESTWHDGTAALWRGSVNTFDLSWPTPGAHTYLVKDRDTSGNLSAVAASATVTVGDGSLIDTGSLVPAAATEIFSDTHDFAGAANGPGGTLPQNGVVWRTFTMTPAVDCEIEFTAKITASGLDGDAGNQLSWYATPSGGSHTLLAGAGGFSTAKASFGGAAHFAATGGVSLDITIETNRAGGTITLYDSYMRATCIKR